MRIVPLFIRFKNVNNPNVVSRMIIEYLNLVSSLYFKSLFFHVDATAVLVIATTMMLYDNPLWGISRVRYANILA